MQFPEVWDAFEEKDVFFLRNQCNEFQQSEVYKGLSILHNVPLTLVTVLKIEALLKAGAIITVLPFSKVPIEEKAEEILKKHGICLIKDRKQIENKVYDIFLDCGAELIDCTPPRIGIVELTRTGAINYEKKNLPVPIIDIDNSNIKKLETFFGTGSGFVKAFKKLFPNSISEHKFLLIGFGKVGQGILWNLKKVCPFVSATVVDFNCDKASLFDVTIINPNNNEQLTEAIASSSVIVTATGIKHCISNFYNSKLFKGKILINMGAEDEFGDSFAASEVVFDKKPINFLLNFPTPMKYLDVVMCIHNYAPKIIMERKLSANYHPLPSDIDLSLLDCWFNIHTDHDRSIIQ